MHCTLTFFEIILPFVDKSSIFLFSSNLEPLLLLAANRFHSFRQYETGQRDKPTVLSNAVPKILLDLHWLAAQHLAKLKALLPEIKTRGGLYFFVHAGASIDEILDWHTWRKFVLF